MQSSVGMLAERLTNRLDPIGEHANVVVEERDDVGARRCNARIPRVRDALLRLSRSRRIRPGCSRASSSTTSRRVVRRVVVDDDEFVAVRRTPSGPEQLSTARRQLGGSVVGRQDDRDVGHSAHATCSRRLGTAAGSASHARGLPTARDGQCLPQAKPARSQHASSLSNRRCGVEPRGAVQSGGCQQISKSPQPRARPGIAERQRGTRPARASRGP